MNDFKKPTIKGNRGTLLCKCASRHKPRLNCRNVQHVTKGDLIALGAFEDDCSDPNLIKSGLISQAYIAFCRGVVLEVRSAGGNMVRGTTVHHPSGPRIGSIQGSSQIIINLRNGGGTRYQNMRISCLAASCPVLLLFVRRLVLLLFMAVRLDMPLFVAIMAGKIGVILFLLTALLNGSCLRLIEGT